jgi:hypothetical protein
VTSGSTFTVNTTPATPGAITGSATQCTAGATGQVYSIATVSGATTYTWSVPTGWSITGGAGTNSITVTVGAAGQNGNISVTAGTGTCNSAASTLAVIVDPTVTANPTPSGATAICAGTTISAGAGGGTSPYTYAWSGGLSAVATPAPASAGTYSVVVTDSKGCTASGSTGALTVNPSPTASITETDASGPTSNDGRVCNGGAATLTAATASGSTYAWSAGGSTSNVASFTGITTNTTYIVTVTNSGCSSTANYTVTVYSAITATPVPTNETSCDNGTGSIALTPTGGTGSYTYSWSGPSYTSTSQNLSSLYAGTYNVTVSDVGCAGTSGTGSTSITSAWSPTATSSSA